ncbi:hypothetical protein ABT127_37150 [Streptomyces sp. NPDC001904]|uniref:hypothetical protein n=1 Tax=Streptomyces sp. NPDC001904 TaxID=3154531 RepID=UPI00331D1680
MNHGTLGPGPQVGDGEFSGITRDPVQARVLRKQLQQLAGNGTSAELREMSREVLSGRIGLREALRIPAYAEALGERASAFRQAWEQMPEEERERQTAQAHRFIEAQQREIETEQAEEAGAVPSGSRVAKHSGRPGWSVY